MPRRAPIWILAAIVAMALAAGCSQGPESASPTVPETISNDGQPTFLAVPAAGVAAPQWGGSETRLIRAQDGGVVREGRFKVTIPPGALASDTWITVRDRSWGYVRCELEPHGIQFQKAVTLEMDLRGLSWAPYTDWSVFWHRNADVWVDQNGVFDNGRVSADLWHFSEYAAGADRGRAGW